MGTAADANPAIADRRLTAKRPVVPTIDNSTAFPLAPTNDLARLPTIPTAAVANRSMESILTSLPHGKFVKSTVVVEVIPNAVTLIESEAA